MNKMQKIKVIEEGEWVLNEEGIEWVMVDYFKHIFHTNNQFNHYKKKEKL